MEDFKERLERLKEQALEEEDTVESPDGIQVSNEERGVDGEVTSQNYRTIGEEKGYIVVDEGSDRIYYIAVEHSEKFSHPEEKVRAHRYVELIEDYGYPPDKIGVEVSWPSSPLRADLVVYEKESEKAFIVVETKPGEIDNEEVKGQGLGYANISGASYLLLAHRDQWLGYDVKSRPIPKDLDGCLSSIPKAWGKAPIHRYVKGEPKQELQGTNLPTLKRIFSSCHDELWGGGERDPAFAFDEFVKLLNLKIYDEEYTNTGKSYKFQVGTHETPGDVAKRVKGLYAEIQGKESSLFKEDIELPDRVIYDVVRKLESISLARTDEDVKGRAYEDFLGVLFRGEYGQYFTQRQIVEFMVDMLEPTQNDVCIDPACGTGGFLLHIMKRVREKSKVDYEGDSDTINKIALDFPRDNLSGIDINARLVRATATDMIVHGGGHTNIENADALGRTFDPKKGIALGRYTLLLTNPPFGSTVKDREVLNQYDTGRRRTSQRSEILFIERCLDFLKPGGRMGIVLPDSISTGPTLRFVRDFIEKNTRVLAIVSLPDFAFVPVGSTVKAHILFLQKPLEKDSSDYPVFMADVDHIGFSSKTVPDINELPEVIERYKRFKEGEELEGGRLGFTVYLSQLKTRSDPKYHLLKQRSPARPGADAGDSSKEVEYEMKRLGEVVEYILPGIDPGIQKIVQPEGAMLIRVGNIQGGKLDLSRDLKYFSEELLGPQGKLKEHQLKFGEILIVTKSTFGRAARFLANEKAIACGALTRVAVKEGVNPDYITAVLNSPSVELQAKRMAKGFSGYVSITLEDVLNLRIPIPPLEIQAKIGSMIEEAHRKQDEAQSTLEEVKREVEEMVTGGEYLIPESTELPHSPSESRAGRGEQIPPSTLSLIDHLRKNL